MPNCVVKGCKNESSKINKQDGITFHKTVVIIHIDYVRVSNRRSIRVSYIFAMLLAWVVRLNQLKEFVLLVEIQKTSPKNQLFYRTLAFLMSLLAMGDQSWWGHPPSNKLVLIIKGIIGPFAPICLLSQIFYLYVNFSELPISVISSMFSIIPVTFIINVKLVNAKQSSYTIVVKDFLSKYHLYNYQDEDDYIKTKLIKVERYIRLTACVGFTFVMFDELLWMIVPMVNNIRFREAISNKTMRMQTCMYIWMPFDYGYNYRNWLIVHAINIYASGLGSCILFVIDLINYAIIFHLLGHIDILKYKIKTKLIANLSEAEVKDRLAHLIQYHSFVLKTFKEVEAAFGLNIGANYFHNMIADSLIIYMIVFGDKQDKMVYGFMILVWMGVLIFVSFILEEVRIQSDELPDLIYNVPWEKWSVSNQKTVMLMLVRTQPVLAFKAIGGLGTGVRPMVSIIKSTFSYYVMLKSTM